MNFRSPEWLDLTRGDLVTNPNGTIQRVSANQIAQKGCNCGGVVTTVCLQNGAGRLHRETTLYPKCFLFRTISGKVTHSGTANDPAGMSRDDKTCLVPAFSSYLMSYLHSIMSQVNDGLYLDVVLFFCSIIRV